MNDIEKIGKFFGRPLEHQEIIYLSKEISSNQYTITRTDVVVCSNRFLKDSSFKAHELSTEILTILL